MEKSTDKVISDLYLQACFLKCKARIYSCICSKSEHIEWIARPEIFEDIIEDYSSQFGVVTKDKAIAELENEGLIESKEVKEYGRYKNITVYRLKVEGGE